MNALTVADDPAAFPCFQAFEDEQGHLWWDMQYLRSAMPSAGDKRKAKDWNRWLTPLLEAECLGENFSETGGLLNTFGL